MNEFEMEAVWRRTCPDEHFCSQYFDFAAALLAAQVAEIAALKAANLKLETLCDATYVAQGADAYNHACNEMERWQAKRRKEGKEVGTEGSLCDGMAWVYGHLSTKDAEIAALRQDALRIAWIHYNLTGTSIRGTVVNVLADHASIESFRSAVDEAIAQAVQPKCIMCHGNGMHLTPIAVPAGVEPPAPVLVKCQQCKSVQPEAWRL